MKIVYESKSVLVCIKPVGVISQSNTSDGLPDLLEQDGHGKLYCVHRLDKNVGGLIVFAKTRQSAAFLSNQIVQGDFVKHYRLLCHGTPKSGIMQDLLFKDIVKNKAYVVKRKRKGVREAALSYETIKEFEIDGAPVSLVEVKLHSGRFHQIRVQFASRGYPLVGDGKYGAKDNIKSPCLFANKLSFIDPDLNDRLTFEAKEEFDISI